MQTKPTAAAACRMQAAAAFETINKGASNILALEERQLFENTALHALRRINEKAPAVGQSFTDAVRLFGYNEIDKAMRIFRKAAAADIAGVCDFWQYLTFASAFHSYRHALRCGMVTMSELRSGRFLKEYSRSASQDLGGFFKAFSKEDFRLAIADSSGAMAVVRKSDTFFCPIAKEWARDAFSSRIYTRNVEYIKAGAPHNNGVAYNDYCALMVSDYALLHYHYGEYGYVDFYHAIILDAEMAEFDVYTFVECGNYGHITEGYFWADGTFHSQPEGQVCRPADAVSGYHSSSRLTNTPVRFSRNAPYLVGFEVEKEDVAVKCSIRHSDFQRELPNFRKERDGSLCDRAGFEFITPPLELSPRNIRAYLEARPVAVAHINAAFSTKCGGHIHISRRGYNGRQLFEMISGHLPLLHALFPARADGNNSRYCEAKSAAQLLSDREKYQSINILNDRIEIRIFGAVRGLDNLIWRAGLVLKLFKHAASTPAVGYEKLPRFFAHLRKVYTTPVEMEALIKRVEKYARKFESYRPDCGADAAGLITNLARFNTYRPATSRLAAKKQSVNS
jgi:hypothetical protein